MILYGRVAMYLLLLLIYAVSIGGALTFPLRAKTRGAALLGWMAYAVIWAVSGYATRTSPKAEKIPSYILEGAFWCGVVAVVAGFIVVLCGPRKRDLPVA